MPNASVHSYCFSNLQCSDFDRYFAIAVPVFIPHLLRVVEALWRFRATHERPDWPVIDFEREQLLHR
jgi:hypothetical protein